MKSRKKECNWVSKVLSDLIAIETVIPPGENYKNFVDYSAKILSSLGMKVRIIHVPKAWVAKYYPMFQEYPRYNLLATLGSGRPILHFNGHYDVVPVGNGWSLDPFHHKSPKNDLIFGRGASDMKGGIAAIMLAMRQIIDHNVDLRGTVEVSLTPDEEIGGHTGVDYILQKKLVKPDYALVAEPSGIDKILIGHKGSLQILLEVYGENAHGSMPWRGKNAFEGSIELARSLKKEYQNAVIRATKKSQYHFSAPQAAKPTIMIGGIHRGGNQQNLVPAYSSFSLDLRLIPEENPVKVRQELLQMIRKIGSKDGLNKFKIKTQILNQVRPAIIDPKSTYLRTIRKIIMSATGKSPTPEVAVGSMDAGFFIAQGIETIAYGPGELYWAHVPNENVSTQNIVTAAEIYEELVKEVLA